MAQLLGVPAEQVIGRSGLGKVLYGVEQRIMAEHVVDGAMPEIISDLYQNTYRSSKIIPDAYEAESFFPRLGTSGHWLFFTAAPLKNAEGKIIGAISTLQDITDRRIAEDALMTSQLEVEQIVEQRTAQLAEVNSVLRSDVERRELIEYELEKRNFELNTLNAKLVIPEHLVQSEKLALYWPIGRRRCPRNK